MKISKNLFEFSVEELQKFRKARVTWAYVNGAMGVLDMALAILFLFLQSIGYCVLFVIITMLWLIEANNDKNLINHIDLVIHLKEKKIRKKEIDKIV